jgi:hypothetical protein
MADGTNQQPAPQSPVIVRNTIDPKTGRATPQYFVNSPYGASPISAEQAFQINTEFYKKNYNVPTGGTGAAGTRKAGREFERGMANIKTRRALSQMQAGQKKRGIRRAGKSAIAQNRGVTAETGGAVRGPVAAMPVEYLSRSMGRGLAQADIAQAQSEAGFTTDALSLEQKRQEALYNISLGRARALEARGRQVAEQLQAAGFSPESIQRVLEGMGQ